MVTPSRTGLLLVLLVLLMLALVLSRFYFSLEIAFESVMLYRRFVQL
jgi:hypothetical protein